MSIGPARAPHRGFTQWRLKTCLMARYMYLNSADGSTGCPLPLQRPCTLCGRGHLLGDLVGADAVCCTNTCTLFDSIKNLWHEMLPVMK
jgi:hypothetical protein